MLIGQPGIPVRLFYDAGDDNTGLYVRAAIFSEGTTSGPASLTTVNLTYNATYDGYTALYTPPYGYDRLIIKYSVYSDSGYTTRDLAYPRVNDQLVLGGYSSGGIGGAAAGAVAALLTAPASGRARAPGSLCAPCRPTQSCAAGRTPGRETATSW